MAQFTLTFSEIEHSGDIARAEGEIARAGARIVKTGRHNYDAESITFVVEAPDQRAVLKALYDMDACCDDAWGF